MGERLKVKQEWKGNTNVGTGGVKVEFEGRMCQRLRASGQFLREAVGTKRL